MADPPQRAQWQLEMTSPPDIAVHASLNAPQKVAPPACPQSGGRTPLTPLLLQIFPSQLGNVRLSHCVRNSEYGAVSFPSKQL